jgi:hypothetical protein
MGQPVVLPKFELPGDRPHWAVRAAWITGGLLLLSVVGLGVAIVHHRNLETEAHIAKAEAIAKVKAEAEAKVAAIAATAKAQREAELEAKRAAQTVPATTVATSEMAGNDSGAQKSSAKSNHSHKAKSSHGTKTSKTASKGGAKTETKAISGRSDAAIDELLKKMK